MHRFRTVHALWRLRIAAIFFLLRSIALAGVSITGGIWMVSDDSDLVAALGLFLLLLFPFFFVHWLVARRSLCPLCMARPMGESGCIKHRDARRWLGSYRLPVAITVVFLNGFRCPYCNESSVLKIRGQRLRKNKRDRR